MQTHAVRFSPIAYDELSKIEVGHGGPRGLTRASLICDDIAYLALRPVEADLGQRFSYISYSLPAPKLNKGEQITPGILDALREVVPQGQVRQNLATCGRLLGFSF